MIRRLVLAFLVLFSLLHIAQAQTLSALARVDVARSGIEDGWFGRTDLTLGLSQGVPFRVFVIDGPPRLVVDFREVDFDGVTSEDLLTDTNRVAEVHFGPFQSGWSRLVARLDQPMLPVSVGLPVDPETNLAQLQIALKAADPEEFSARVQPEVALNWGAAPLPQSSPATPPDDRFVVAIDPGHGGIDPGAVRGEVTEADLMLQMGLQLRDTLRRSGRAEVVMTRDTDQFVSLPGRLKLAHQAGADLFISLHADALEDGGARGATVYTLSQEASDRSAAQLAAQHDRSDIISGVDLGLTDDQIAKVLIDIARGETMPRTLQLAGSLVEHIKASGAPVYSKPHRQAAFSVLKSADIPSVLVEVGFLSDERDLKNLRDPVWRAIMVQALADAILAWRDEDELTRPLVRR